jgi:hypothetical protein
LKRGFPPGGQASRTDRRVILWMRTTGAHDDRTTSAASRRCLRSCMPAVVRPRCCTFCCTELTCKSQGGSVRFPPDQFSPPALASSSRSQVAMRTISAVALLTCEQPSVSVRWCPSLVLGAVTHFVTRSADLDDGDLPLRRSFRLLRSTAALVIRAGFLVVLVALDVRGFHLVRAREGHAARPSMRTMGACQVGTTTAASGRCLRSCMRAVVRPCCCASCCTDLTRNCRSSSVRLPQATLSALHRPVWRRVPPNR